MKLADKNSCVGCGACANACAFDALRMTQDGEGFYVPTLAAEKCKNCGACEKVCLINGDAQNVLEQSGFYACRSKDAEVALASSSGGMFAECAKSVLAEGGVVFGAALTDDCKSLKHVSTDEVPLEKLQKSKYFESDMGDVFRKMKKELTNGRKVLFCGTPCQATAVRAFFGNRFENLIVLDFLCHGAPSQKAYKKYVDDLERKYNDVVSKVDFRSKKLGWRTYCMYVEFKSGKKYLQPGTADPYFRFFFSKKGLRNSCYSCDRADRSAADITLGDFWGVKDYPEIKDDDSGISIVSTHTEKGKAFFEVVAKKIDARPLEFDAVSYAYGRPPRKTPDKRIDFETFDFFNNSVFKPLTLRMKIRAFILRNNTLRNLFRKMRG